MTDNEDFDVLPFDRSQQKRVLENVAQWARHDSLARILRMGNPMPAGRQIAAFVSVDCALRFQDSAASLIAPSGECQAYFPYGREGVLMQEIRIEDATGLLATRYAPERYQEPEME